MPDSLSCRRYLTLLREALLQAECALHAYVLMDNHTHLLVTPPRKGAVSTMMQRLGRQNSGLFNARHGRTGTQWEGRYKSCLVDSAEYLLCCYRYIDFNPVRARMVEIPKHAHGPAALPIAGARIRSSRRALRPVHRPRKQAVDPERFRSGAGRFCP